MTCPIVAQWHREYPIANRRLLSKSGAIGAEARFGAWRYATTFSRRSPPIAAPQVAVDLMGDRHNGLCLPGCVAR